MVHIDIDQHDGTKNDVSLTTIIDVRNTLQKRIDERQSKRRSIRSTKRRILYISGIGADGNWGEKGVIPKTIKANQIGYKPYKSEQKEDEEEGYDSNESMLMTEDPVVSISTQSESMGLGYDSDATVLMTGSPGLDTDTDSEVRMLGYNWNTKLKGEKMGCQKRTPQMRNQGWKGNFSIMT